MNQPSPTAMRAWRAFLEAHALIIRQLDDELQREHALPLSWYDVLVQLDEAGGRRKMSDLADAVLLTRSNCTRLVDRMEGAGLVERHPDPVDARSKWAVLTDAGSERLAEAAPLHLDGIERMFAAYLSDRDAAMIARALASMAELSNPDAG